MPQPPTRSRAILAALWPRASAIYLATLLVFLAAGLYAREIFPPRQAVTAAPLPTLQLLAIGQILFALIVWPLVCIARRDNRVPACGDGVSERGEGVPPLRPEGVSPSSSPLPCRTSVADGSSARAAGGPPAGSLSFWPQTILETLAYLAVAVPFYLVAAYLADATATDAIRTALFVLSVWTFAWAGGYWIARGRSPALPVLLGLALTAGSLALVYVQMEFLAVFRADWLTWICPITAAWNVSGSRVDSILPEPLRIAAIWPAAAAVWTLVTMMLPKRP